jgi:flavorubredoxin
MTYMTGTNILFSNDAFGQHFCGSSLFADEVDESIVWAEAIKYFAGILSPFIPLIKRKVAEVAALNLPLEMIAPSHGVIWRRDPLRIVSKYAEWADDYDEGYVTIAYDTMYQATRKMAEAIGHGVEAEGLQMKLFNTALCDQSDLMTDFFRSRGIILGSATVNNGALRSMAGVLDELRGHKLKNKVGFTFGSFGWSGEAPRHLQHGLEEAGIKAILEPVTARYTPSVEELKACHEAGRAFAKAIREAKS